jgi:alpha 1,2-mannosyltransferase
MALTRFSRTVFLSAIILFVLLLAGWHYLGLSEVAVTKVVSDYKHDDTEANARPVSIEPPATPTHLPGGKDELEAPDVPVDWPAHVSETDAYTPWEDDDSAAGEPVEIDFEDAHLLPSADAFRTQHFHKVFALPGMTISEAKQTCNWTADDNVNYMFGDDVEWNMAERPDGEIAVHRQAWQSFIQNDVIPYKEVEERFRGRGIVLLAGNKRTLQRTKVILSALVRLNSTVPVEVHYYDKELDDDKKGQLTRIYPHIVFNDLAGDHNIMSVGFNPLFINYQLKTAALLNSRWAEPMLLDSDNIPVIDPAELWASPTYKEFGTVFWPDIARTRPRNPAWALTNTPCRMDEYELESGQLLVDKARFWYHVQLAARMNNDPDRYYDDFLLGDKDTFRFAWLALKTRYGRPRRWLTSIGTKFGGDGASWSGYCGHTFAQHHPDDGRVAFLHGGLLKTMPDEAMRWHRDHEGGVFRWYKRASTDQDPSRLVNVEIVWQNNEHVPDLPPDTGAQLCTEMHDIEARDAEEILPGFEDIFREIGGYWPVDGLT